MVSSKNLFAISLGGMLAMALAGALVPLRHVIDNANVALLLAAVVVASAGFGGRVAGGVTAVLAALSFDVAHTVPYGSLKIADTDDLLTAALLVVIGLVAGEVAERLSDLRNRRSHLTEFQRLHRVAQRASAGDTVEDLTLQVTAELLECLGLRDCWYEPAPFLGELPTLAPDGSLSTRVYTWAAGGFELPRSGASIPVRVGGRVLARFVLAPTSGAGVPVERRLVALALVDQLAVVLAAAAA
jgi:hypothetical protein